MCHYGTICPVEQVHTNNEFRRLRLHAGLSIPEAAEATGYAVRTIHRWEGPRRNHAPKGHHRISSWSG